MKTRATSLSAKDGTGVTGTARTSEQEGEPEASTSHGTGLAKTRSGTMIKPELMQFLVLMHEETTRALNPPGNAFPVGAGTVDVKLDFGTDDWSDVEPPVGRLIQHEELSVTAQQESFRPFLEGQQEDMGVNGMQDGQLPSSVEGNPEHFETAQNGSESARIQVPVYDVSISVPESQMALLPIIAPGEWTWIFDGTIEILLDTEPNVNNNTVSPFRFNSTSIDGTQRGRLATGCGYLPRSDQVPAMSRCSHSVSPFPFNSTSIDGTQRGRLATGCGYLPRNDQVPAMFRCSHSVSPFRFKSTPIDGTQRGRLATGRGYLP